MADGIKGRNAIFPFKARRSKPMTALLSYSLWWFLFGQMGRVWKLLMFFRKIGGNGCVKCACSTRPAQRRDTRNLSPRYYGKTLHLLPSLGDHLAMYICRSEWINEIVYLKSKHVLWDIFNKSRSLWERLRYNLWRRARTSPCPVQLHQLGWQAQTIALRFKQRHLLRCVGTHSAKTREN